MVDILVDENIMNYPDFDRNTKRVTKVTLLFSVVPPGIEPGTQGFCLLYTSDAADE